MKYLLLIFFLVTSIGSQASCLNHENKGKVITPLFQERYNSKLEYICSNVYDEANEKGDDEYSHIDFCIYKSDEVSMYIEEYVRKKNSNIGYFKVSHVDALEENRVVVEDDKNLKLSLDTRDILGYGFFFEVKIKKDSGTGHLRLSYKVDEDEGLMSYLFNKAESVSIGFECKRVE